MEILYNSIKNFTKCRLNADIGKTSWIGAGGVADLLILPENIEELSQVLKIYSTIQTGHKMLKMPKEINKNANIACGEIHSWMLIEGAGLRGFSIGGAQVSTIHCNFLVNKGGATAADFENLGEHVIQKVYEKFKVKLEWEVERIGDFGNEL